MPESGYWMRHKASAFVPRLQPARATRVAPRRKVQLMADDKSNSEPPDRNRISLGVDYEVRDWTKSPGVTEDELRAAIDAVGNSADKVRDHLKAR